jgi:YfiH family protein
MLSFPGLLGVEGLRHGVTTRAGGASDGRFESLNLGASTGDRPERVAENRRRAAAALGFADLVTARQVHGAAVAALEAGGGPPGEADALATDVPGVLLGVLGADCPGVLVVDPVRRAVAVVHSGWRGTAAGVVPAAVRFLGSRYGSRPEDLRAGIGPGISAARYEVGPEVVAALRDGGAGLDGAATRGTGDRWRVDLSGAVEAQLVACGVRPWAIERMSCCTHDDEASFFSHRRDGAATGRHGLLAGWRD